MTSKKAPSIRCSALPRASDYTKTFLKEDRQQPEHHLPGCAGGVDPLRGGHQVRALAFEPSALCRIGIGLLSKTRPSDLPVMAA
jgi:hypothetical protein